MTENKYSFEYSILKIDTACIGKDLVQLLETFF